MSIPLVQNNEKDSINTSIIAIKRQIERINALLGLSNSEEIDTSVFATKTELEDAVTQVETDLAPVDEVALNNMHSVTSNGVAEAVEGYLIWENPDPSQGFDSQTITFDRAIPDRYSKVRIMYRNITSEDYYFYTECVVGDRCYLNSSYVTSNGVQWVTSRLFRNFTRTTVEIGTCQTYSSSSGYSSTDRRCIPTRIWAIK